jgi:hypothetical protein
MTTAAADRQRRRKRPGVHVKRDFILVVIDNDGEEYLEFRPAYRQGIGPVIDIHRVNLVEPEYVATLTVFSVRELVKYLPTAINAAFRAEAKARKQHP